MMLATVLTLVTALPQHGGDEVWAILQQHCVRCHGPEKQKGKLRLDTKDGVASVVVAGDPAQSELVRRIRLPRDDDEVMPPEDELPAAAVDALVRWVGDGAPMAAIEAAASRSAATTQLTRERQQALEAATGASCGRSPGQGSRGGSTSAARRASLRCIPNGSPRTRHCSPTSSSCPSRAARASTGTRSTGRRCRASNGCTSNVRRSTMPGSRGCSRRRRTCNTSTCTRRR
jgi:hypothetical protein